MNASDDWTFVEDANAVHNEVIFNRFLILWPNGNVLSNKNSF